MIRERGERRQCETWSPQLGVSPVDGHVEEEEEGGELEHDAGHQDAGGLLVPHAEDAEHDGGGDDDEAGEAAGHGDVDHSEPLRHPHHLTHLGLVLHTLVSQPGQ